MRQKGQVSWFEVDFSTVKRTNMVGGSFMAKSVTYPNTDTFH